MTDKDPFWNLVDLKEISTQEEFFEELKKSDTLMGLWYIQQVLECEEGRRTEIRNKKFVGCRFSHTQIIGITFRNCVFESCLFIGATFRDCSIHRCSFRSTNTHKISIEETYINPLSFDDCLDKDRHQNIGTHLYQELLKNSRDEDQIHFERDARFLFLRWERYQKRYELGQKIVELRGLAQWLKLLLELLTGSVSCSIRWIWEFAFGSGVRIGRFLMTAVLVALVFFGFNFFFRKELGLELDGRPIEEVTEAWYFTVVSLTTLGYGDITPTTSLGQLVASAQSIVGFLLLALLASMIFRRLFP